ncbi:hypothetical protein [Chelatococcus asaccharovorans]|nr:hypothetical protein [Chelatococcus asaccharovorans]CAH1664971.1 hypothetical protein CHELA17_60293 [Chelatococcus asaccharovorans]
MTADTIAIADATRLAFVATKDIDNVGKPAMEALYLLKPTPPLGGTY